jgi:ABC-2 type transport system ATP-binding protein
LIQAAPFVETHGLTKQYDMLVALRNCTFEVRRGEVFGLLGPNGSGKTTLIRLLMGFLKPSAGYALIDGLDCYRQSVAVHARATYLPAEARLFRQMRGREVLEFFSRVRPGGDFGSALALAERLDLDITRQVAYFSTGMRQKLALAACLSANTPLVILDEPTANLDPTMRGEVLDMVREARDAGRTVLFSSHVLSEIEQSCDRVVILRSGELVHTQVMSELHRQHRIRAELTGALPPVPPELANELRVHVNGDGDLKIETPGELSPLLGWLATLPIREVRVEPVGLQALYERFHSAESA